jgi:hypothetical protein
MTVIRLLGNHRGGGQGLLVSPGAMPGGEHHAAGWRRRCEADQADRLGHAVVGVCVASRIHPAHPGEVETGCRLRVVHVEAPHRRSRTLNSYSVRRREGAWPVCPSCRCPARHWADNRSTAFAWLRRPVEARSGDWTCLVLAPPWTPWLARSIWISRYGLDCGGRMARSASDATGPVQSVSAVLAGLRQARAGDRGGSWDGASGSG